MNHLKPKEIAHRIRKKVADLNDELILAAAAEIDIEFVIHNHSTTGEPIELRVFCSQEV